ncbi:hypothetical protein GPX89_14845 [Nocardia sp. ET3-3]|uniref:Uncharacterized protein n=1 Tax=Nocardia terrae TaxID=2675851 RepID=A0A7K1UWH9_9NOCA|nr:hypothetical protein [Nocardia terrae]MVU78519.1 hypothetical protein [Nocardia terrae]
MLPAFLWAVFAIGPVLLFAGTLGRLGHHPSATWLALGVIALAILTSLLESLLVAVWKRDAGEMLLAAPFTLAAGAGLWWVLHAMPPASLHI